MATGPVAPSNLMNGVIDLFVVAKHKIDDLIGAGQALGVIGDRHFKRHPAGCLKGPGVLNSYFCIHSCHLKPHYWTGSHRATNLKALPEYILDKASRGRSRLFNKFWCLLSKSSRA